MNQDRERFLVFLFAVALICLGTGNIGGPIIGTFFQQSAPTWDDLEFPLASINPAGAPAPATFNQDEVCWEFSGSTDNAVALTWQMRHRKKLGTAIHPHIHIMSAGTSTAQTDWRLITVFQRLGATNSFAISAITNNFSFTPPGVANVHGYQEAAEITPPLLPEDVSMIVQAKLLRLGSSDANSEVMRLIGADLHYQVDSMGSDSETSKSF